MKNRLEELLLKLYYHPTDRFYSHLFFQVDRIKDNKNCPTLGVAVRDGRIKLYYNTDFLETLSDKAAIEILKHEALHLINEHILRGSGAKEKNAVKHKMENIAMDCSINQLLDQKIIDDIGGVTLDRFKSMLTGQPDTFKPKENMVYEYYFDLMEQEKEHREQNGDVGGQTLEELLDGMSMDDHDGFGEMDALDQAMLEDKIRKAAESAKGDGAGKLPSEVEELLKLKKKPTISWQREIKQFIGQGARAEKKTSRSRRHRRYGIVYPGKKRDYVARILVVLDSSGSMHGDRTDKVLSELYGIYKSMPDGLNLDVVECDAEIQNVFTYDGSETFKVTGRGGTQMTPGLIYAHENGYDGVIFLSDGEYWDEDFEAHNKVPSLWVITGNDSYKSPIGRTINIPR